MLDLEVILAQSPLVPLIFEYIRIYFEYPENIDIVYINIAENKQQNLSGYAIDKNSNFYLLTWDFEFIKLDLNEFDYKKMRLKFIADPVNYLIRYDDQKNYYAVIYSKELRHLESTGLCSCIYFIK